MPSNARAGAIRALSILLVASGCATAPPATLGGRTGPAILDVVVRLPSGSPTTRGTLWVGWVRPDEAAALRRGVISSKRLTAVVAESVLVRDAVLGGADTRTVALPHPGGPAVPFAVLDSQHALWDTLGGRGQGNYRGVAAAPARPEAGRRTQVDLTLARIDRPRQPQRPSCLGPRTERIPVRGPRGEPRFLCVVLPPSYAAAKDRRYPVIYHLPGLFGDDGAVMSVVRTAADRAARAEGQEVIAVGVDTRTPYGSSYLVGAWEPFLAQDVVRAVDARFRTRPVPAARALIGISTGGFNAVSFGIRHPDVFGAVGALCADALAFRPWLLGPDGRVRPVWLAWTRLEDAAGGKGQLVSYGTDWSPDPSRARGFAWPMDLATGHPIPAVLDRWLAHSPDRMLDDPTTLARVRRVLGGRLFIGAGKEDEFRLYPPAVAFSHKLRQLGVEHTFVAWDGGHGDHIVARYTQVIRFLVRRMAAP